MERIPYATQDKVYRIGGQAMGAALSLNSGYGIRRILRGQNDAHRQLTSSDSGAADIGEAVLSIVAWGDRRVAWGVLIDVRPLRIERPRYLTSEPSKCQ